MEARRDDGGLGTPRHIGMIVADVDRAVRMLGATLGLGWHAPTETVVRVRAEGSVDEWPLQIVHSSTGPMRVELLRGPAGSPWHTDAVAELHHYAYATTSLAADCERLLGQGWTIEVTPDADDGRPSGFAYLGRAGRPRIELFEIRT